MEVTGMLYGAKLLEFAGYPTADVLGPDASEGDIKALIEKHGSVFVKPVFKGGVGKKGKAGLIGRASDLKTALKEKERLYFVEHRVGNTVAKANGVTFEGAVPAEHEVYFSIADSTRFRAPTMTLTHEGAMPETEALGRETWHEWRQSMRLEVVPHYLTAACAADKEYLLAILAGQRRSRVQFTVGKLYGLVADFMPQVPRIPNSP
jgi:succinyl-CoA synthetase beta subunit